MPSDHYFTEHPTSVGARRALTVTLRGFELHLTTQAGVFSRDRVDPGTAVLIRHMQVRPTDRVLDLGCGYGVVGIIAAKLAPQGHVTLVDINERAVALARENLAANGITNAEALQGDGFAPVTPSASLGAGGRLFDLIALNPPIRAGLAVVHSLIEQAHAHLASGHGSPSPVLERGQGGEDLPLSARGEGAGGWGYSSLDLERGPGGGVLTPSPVLERGMGGEDHRSDSSTPRLLDSSAVPAARFYLVGRTKQGVVRISQKMHQVFGNVEEVAKGGGYRLYLSQRS
ncbi:MAG: class I SAM-dependent methyltransferase [Armatimonadota bacterium]